MGELLLHATALDADSFAPYGDVIEMVDRGGAQQNCDTMAVDEGGILVDVAADRP